MLVHFCQHIWNFLFHQHILPLLFIILSPTRCTKQDENSSHMQAEHREVPISVSLNLLTYLSLKYRDTVHYQPKITGTKRKNITSPWKFSQWPKQKYDNNRRIFVHNICLNSISNTVIESTQPNNSPKEFQPDVLHTFCAMQVQKLKILHRIYELIHALPLEILLFLKAISPWILCTYQC